MYKTLIFFLILLFSISCVEREEAKQSFNHFKLSNYNEKMANFFKMNNIKLAQNDTIIVFDSQGCTDCVRNSFVESIKNKDSMAYRLVLFKESDLDFFKQSLKNLKIILCNDSILKRDKILHSKPYKYYLDSKGQIESVELN